MTKMQPLSAATINKTLTREQVIAGIVALELEVQKLRDVLSQVRRNTANTYNINLINETLNNWEI